MKFLQGRGRVSVTSNNWLDVGSDTGYDADSGIFKAWLYLRYLSGL